jgi:acyl-CoA synthetase (NDP forming)
VALKLASLTIVHKTEVGGVRLGLPDDAAVRAAFEEIRSALKEMGRANEMEGVLVQPMLSGAAETIIGAQADRLFGHLIAFGLGGIHVEVLRDVAFRVAPLTDRDAREMTDDIRGSSLLAGYRGHPAADVDALREALLRVSRLVEAVPEIREMDLNPTFALPPGSGIRVADARIRVARPGEGASAGPQGTVADVAGA